MICLYNRQAIHNAEKGEPAALLLSPRIASAMPGVESIGNGGQFTYFLTAPMQAFCQLAGITSDIDSVCSFIFWSRVFSRYLFRRSNFYGFVFRIHMLMRRTYFSLLWNSMKKSSARLLDWTLSGDKFYLIHFSGAWFSGTVVHTSHPWVFGSSMLVWQYNILKYLEAWTGCPYYLHVSSFRGRNKQVCTQSMKVVVI